MKIKEVLAVWPKVFRLLRYSSLKLSIIGTDIGKSGPHSARDVGG